MKERAYKYVGTPEKIRPGQLGVKIQTVSDIAKVGFDIHIAATTFTFTVDVEDIFRLAPRRSEHVNCAGGKPVLSAGEISLEQRNGLIQATAISNHSTGYCPEADSWSAVQRALNRLGIVHSGLFTTALLFRRCPACNQINIIKDQWFHCDVCDAKIPREPNI